MLTKNITEIIKEFKAQARNLYGQRLKDVVLYGSWARGEARPDSDIDLLIILDGEVTPGREIDRMIDLITDFSFKYDVLLSVYPISEFAYRQLNSPLLLNIRKEGISA
jgi:predicted nucleotidyltransferase